MSDADDLLIATTLDAARVVEDYLGSLLALTRGHVDRGAAPRRFERLRHALHVQERGVVRGFAFGYGSEQLRKASIAARDLASAVRELETAQSESARGLASELGSLGLLDLPDLLADEVVTVQSPLLDDALERLHNAMGTMRRAHLARSLSRMRREQPGKLTE